jgi:hypothetical protein
MKYQECPLCLATIIINELPDHIQKCPLEKCSKCNEIKNKKEDCVVCIKVSHSYPGISS